jgi:hypothetical protein
MKHPKIKVESTFKKFLILKTNEFFKLFFYKLNKSDEFNLLKKKYSSGKLFRVIPLAYNYPFNLLKPTLCLIAGFIAILSGKPCIVFAILIILLLELQRTITSIEKILINFFWEKLKSEDGGNIITESNSNAVRQAFTNKIPKIIELSISKATKEILDTNDYENYFKTLTLYPLVYWGIYHIITLCFFKNL